MGTFMLLAMALGWSLVGCSEGETATSDDDAAGDDATGDDATGDDATGDDATDDDATGDDATAEDDELADDDQAADDDVTVDNPDEPSAGDELPLENFVEQYLRAGCALTLGCRLGRDQDVRLLLGDEERCVEALDVQLGGMLRAWVQEVNSGRFAYDAAAAARCVDELPRTCGLFEPEEPAHGLEGLCAGVFEGNVELGGACNSDVECAGDAYCTTRNGDCAGVCAARAKPGEICEEEQRCSAEGALHGFCHPVTGVCTQVSRGDESELGEPCMIVDDSEGSALLRACQDGAECFIRSGDGMTTRSCERPIEVGEPCQGEGDVCADGALCLSLDGEPDTCHTVTVQRRAGDACGEALTVCDRFAHLSCSDAGVCEQEGDGREGSACSSGRCDSGFFCNDSSEPSVPAACEPLLELGEACDYPWSCVSGQCARDGSGGSVCTRRFCAE